MFLTSSSSLLSIGLLIAAVTIGVINAVTVCDIRPTLRLYSGYASYGQSNLRDDVIELQIILNDVGGYDLISDGLFGPGTDAAVRNWQSFNGLGIDGIVGPNTWKTLCDDDDDDDDDDDPPPSDEPSGTVSSCTALPNPYPIESRGTVAIWNDIAQFVKDELDDCFPGLLYCSTYISGSSSSDHPGNGLDCFPGKYGEYASGQDLIDGNDAALWLVDNAATLKIRYVIWQNKIWNIRRSSEGWRNYGKSGPTQGHYDHIHISVYSDIN